MEFFVGLAIGLAVGLVGGWYLKGKYGAKGDAIITDIRK